MCKWAEPEPEVKIEQGPLCLKVAQLQRGADIMLVFKYFSLMLYLIIFTS